MCARQIASADLCVGTSARAFAAKFIRIDEHTPKRQLKMICANGVHVTNQIGVDG